MPITVAKVDQDDTELIKKIFRLRYQVYCLECGFLKAEDYPDGIETDEYDAQSIHFAAINDDNEVVGAARLVLEGSLPFPLEKYCPDVAPEKLNINRSQCAEISRLVISKELRRRKFDDLYYEPQTEDNIFRGPNENPRQGKREKPMAFDIYRTIYAESVNRGIKYWYTLMEKSLYLLLRIHGFQFDSVGEEVDCYGKVKPYLADIPKIEIKVRNTFPEIFKYFTAKLNEDQRKAILARKE